MEIWNTEAIILFVFLFGLIIGSFLNCFIWRTRREEGIQDRSYCPRCSHKLAWYDNIPLVSYVVLRGKCRHCSQSISIQYPLVELATGVLFVTSFLFRSGTFPERETVESILILARDWFVIGTLIFVFVYDLRWYLILDKIILPATAVVLIFNLVVGVNWPGMIISAIIGGGFFLVQFLISRGMWIGGGDIRMGMFMGVALGDWQHTIVALFLAYLLGSAVGTPLILAKKKEWGSKIPFGVFLSLATLVALFWAGDILNWYLGYLI